MSVFRRSASSPRLALLLPVLLLTGAAACGSGSSSPTDPGGPENQVSPSSVRVEARIYQLMDDSRRNASLRSLALDGHLSEIARAHSRAMRDYGFFAHVDHVGHDFSDRLAVAGVTYAAAAENIARNTDAGDPARFAHDQLMASPPHRANILDPRFEEVGIGVARRGSTYWITELFVRRR